MGAVVGAVLLAAVLVAIVAAFTWQGWRRWRGDGGAVYVLDEAAGFVHDRLEAATRGRITRSGVQRILEWNVEYQQVEAPRLGLVPVSGSGDSVGHILARAAERGADLDPAVVAEVLAAEVEYLLSIRAVGEPAGEESP